MILRERQPKYMQCSKQHKRFAWFSLVLLLAAGGLMLYRENRILNERIELENFERAVISYVIDGDTAVVLVGDKAEKVRFIGIDCEESASRRKDENTEIGSRASEFMKKLLPEGCVVYLQKDVSDRDRYDRLLRYVWIDLPLDPQDEAEIREKMISAVLIREGHAQVMDFPPDLLYSDLLWNIQRGKIK